MPTILHQRRISRAQQAREDSRQFFGFGILTLMATLVLTLIVPTQLAKVASPESGIWFWQASASILAALLTLTFLGVSALLRIQSGKGGRLP